MSAQKVYRAIGLMSGTSLDGEIDVALIETDGQAYVKPLGFKPFPYDLSVREKVRACFGQRTCDEAIIEAEALVTDLHIAAVKASGFEANIIGFHGQTITHAPHERFTWQLGDGARLARETGIDVINDMRQADIKAGGQGAPLIPLYHAAMMANQVKPVAVLNLGGVGNITFIDNFPLPEGGGRGRVYNGDSGSSVNPYLNPPPQGGGDHDMFEIIAFDTGPANAMMDDFIMMRMKQPFDKEGALAREGVTDHAVLEQFLADPYFKKTGPKSLDRNAWNLKALEHLNATDGMATLLEMSVQAVRLSLAAMPSAPKALYVCGGGRKNIFMMQRLEEILEIPVQSIESAGWNGDTTEAEGFGYLAVRSLLGLPLSLPSTTGVPEPITGGVLCKAK